MPLLCTQTLCFHINTENFADEPAEKFPLVFCDITVSPRCSQETYAANLPKNCESSSREEV